MSDLSSLNGNGPVERWEAQLVAVARALPYPPTPNPLAVPAVRARLTPPPAVRAVAPRVAPRRAWGWALAAVLVALLSLLAVPAVRASLVEIFQLGVVRVILGPLPTPTPEPTTTGTPPPPSTRTPQPTSTPLASVLDLAGQTTWADALSRVDLPLRLPAGLGEPDAVFVQDLEGEAVVLVWLEPDDPSQVRLSLHFLASSQLVDKLIKDQPADFERTRVNGREAFWTTGPYFIVARNGHFTQSRLITGHVLIWYEDDVTYRLETSLPLAEAIKMAESLE